MARFLDKVMVFLLTFAIGLVAVAYTATNYRMVACY